MSQDHQNHDLEEEEYEPDVIYLENEDGEEIAYEIVKQFEVHSTGKQYMMLLPYEDEEADEVIAFRFEEDEEGIQLYPIDDAEEWEIVEQTFNYLMTQEDEIK